MMTKWAKAALFVVLVSLAGCIAPAGSLERQEPWQVALGVLRAAGDAELRYSGAALLDKYAPGVLPLVDTGYKVTDAEGVESIVGAHDGVLTFAEVEQFVTAASDPERLTWLFLLARALAVAPSGAAGGATTRP